MAPTLRLCSVELWVPVDACCQCDRTRGLFQQRLPQTRIDVVQVKGPLLNVDESSLARFVRSVSLKAVCEAGFLEEGWGNLRY